MLKNHDLALSASSRFTSILHIFCSVQQSGRQDIDGVIYGCKRPHRQYCDLRISTYTFLLGCEDNRVESADHHVQAEEDEVLVVVKANTHSHEETMMVSSQDLFLTQFAVMRSLRLICSRT